MIPNLREHVSDVDHCHEFGLAASLRKPDGPGMPGEFLTWNDIVVDRVELTLVPNEIDTEKRRRIEWSADRLMLTTLPALADGSSREDRLTWERVLATGAGA